MNILAELQHRFRAALAELVDDPAEFLAMIRPSGDPKFGDYQANFAMPLGKRLSRPPRDVAADVVAKLKVDDFCDPPEVAGPGFINLRVKDAWLAEQAQRALRSERLNVEPVAAPRTYVLDYSSPNVAKSMHVGHIRSTVIGDSLKRTLKFLGHRVISDNHIGDWGTQFGMIIYGYKHIRDEAAYQADPVTELGRLYRLVSKLVSHIESKQSLPAAREQLANKRPKSPGRQPRLPPNRPTRLPRNRSAVRKGISRNSQRRWRPAKLRSPRSTAIQSCRSWSRRTRRSIAPCWPKRPSCITATRRTCGCGTSFCRRAWSASSGSIAGWM
jgi:hypothetical protein